MSAAVEVLLTPSRSRSVCRRCVTLNVSALFNSTHSAFFAARTAAQNYACVSASTFGRLERVYKKGLVCRWEYWNNDDRRQTRQIPMVPKSSTNHSLSADPENPVSVCRLTASISSPTRYGGNLPRACVCCCEASTVEAVVYAEGGWKIVRGG